jgi:hypothetical protein
MENLRLKKYQKKLAKALKKLRSFDANLENDASQECDDQVQLKLKIEKYERKIREVSSGEECFVEADRAEERKEVDKSGMSLLLFYAYVEPPWSSARHTQTLHWAEETLKSLGVSGRLRVAREGFNGTLTGPYDGIRAFTDRLRERDNGYFAHMNNIDDFKITDHLPAGQAFPKLKVFAVTG